MTTILRYSYIDGIAEVQSYTTFEQYWLNFLDGFYKEKGWEMKSTTREEHERRSLIMTNDLKHDYGSRILPKEFSWEEDGNIEFEREEDAVAFKLRWS